MGLVKPAPAPPAAHAAGLDQATTQVSTPELTEPGHEVDEDHECQVKYSLEDLYTFNSLLSVPGSVDDVLAAKAGQYPIGDGVQR